jgi:hypothetical protein
MKPNTPRPYAGCSISATVDRLITERAKNRGVSRAAIVREILEEHFTYWPEEKSTKGESRSVWEGDANR